MPHDPLADHALSIPAARAAEAGMDPKLAQELKDDETRERLVAEALRYVTHDAVVVSPYSRMSPSQQRVFADRHGIPKHERIINETTLVRVLIYCDAVRTQQGQPALAVAELPPEPDRRPVVVAHIPKLEPSPTNEWIVLETRDVSMPGGIFRVHKGAIYKLADVGAELLESMASQGLKLEPWPRRFERHQCPVCSSSWPAVIGSKRTTAECPVCYVINMGAGATVDGDPSDAAAHAAMVRGQLGAAEAEIVELRNRADDLGIRHAILTRWAVEQGAQPPGPDGTWQGEPHPPTLQVVLEERDRVALHASLVADGMSDYEARATCWPTRSAPPPELGEIAQPPATPAPLPPVEVESEGVTTTPAALGDSSTDELSAHAIPAPPLPPAPPPRRKSGGGGRGSS